MKKIQKEVDRLNDQIKKYKEFGTNSRNRPEHLQELVGWKNFLENATGLPETERIKKYKASGAEFRCLYFIQGDQ
ncbi:MAG: hypothetical protein DLD55_01190 [candidate division SR1 bacterium]|nr:MAG: hypothetical protein DLD55_01190 [candidate division SR1 bacterium]